MGLAQDGGDQLNRPLKVMVVDDTLTNIKHLEAVARRLGHVVVTAMDGYQAVERFAEESPDLVFMDVMMPRMDGITAVEKIRALPSERWVPIIFYSALDKVDDIVRGLEVGGDDYLTKPANLHVIRAKINSYARSIQMQDEIRRHTAELVAWQAQAEEQNSLGQYVITRLVDAEGLRDPLIAWRNIPAQIFSGDLVCAARAPGDVLYLMLADAAGHGLHAALTALPLTQIFYGMTSKGFPITSIAEELNRKLKGFLPVDRFVATTLVALDARNQTVEIWNGGNPDALFVNDSGGITMRWTSTHPPLGILPPELFSSSSETFNYQQPGELVVCSDGVVEAESPEGIRLNMEGLEALLRGAPAGQRCIRLDAGVSAHLNGRKDHDDISWMVVKVPLAPDDPLCTATSETVSPARTDQASSGQPPSEWGLSITWSAAELRRVDVVPAVLGMMGHVDILNAHRGPLFLIISELFNNALDHGLLHLDSAIKNLEGGIESYLDERAQRLEALAGGKIEMHFSVREVADRRVVEIELIDTGQGFDYYPYIAGAASAAPPSGFFHGRGIQLVREMCVELNYHGSGNRVVARYAL